MKKFLVFIVVALLCYSCENEEFDVENPDVKEFVKLIKEGNYNSYRMGDKGEKLWLLMPAFDKSDIKDLLNYAKDTSHVEEFPINPISSRTPFPNGRDYFILSECLLWTIEGIRNGSGYGSLDPFLIDLDLSDYYSYKGLNCDKILIVRDLYLDWWNKYKEADWQEKYPLEDTPYGWY